MNEWQPPRAVAGHGVKPSEKPALVELALKTVIEVKPIDFDEGMVSHYRKDGCNATRFFVSRSNHPSLHNCLWCEHEILTD